MLCLKSDNTANDDFLGATDDDFIDAAEPRAPAVPESLQPYDSLSYVLSVNNTPLPDAMDVCLHGSWRRSCYD